MPCEPERLIAASPPFVHVEQVQDGVLRLRYKAGDRALHHVSEEEKQLRDAAGVLSVHAEELPRTVERFFEEWKAQKRELEELWEKNAESTAADFAKADKTERELNAPQKLLEKIALKTVQLNPKASAVLWNKEGFITAAAGVQSAENAVEMLK